MMLSSLLLVSASLVGPAKGIPLPTAEFRAAWVATVDNIDWPSKPGLSTEQQVRELDAIVDKVAELRMNAIIFQVRPHGDSLYPSKLEPWSYYLSGQQGKAPQPAWDPLQHLIEKAHAKGIEVHAWFNPYRSNHPRQLGPQSSDHIGKRRPDLVYQYGTFQWMDPGKKDVQDQSFNVFMDVVERYAVDGIHIDDYFYPYPVREDNKTLDFPDEVTYQAYRKAGGKLSKSDWRRDNVNGFVKRVYEGIRKRKNNVKFGISPFGIYRPGVPKGTTAGIDQYEALAADALLWWQKGWCDYMAPQLYWTIESAGQSFPKLLAWWRETNSKERHLWPGLYTSRLEPSNPSFVASQIPRQIGLTRLPEGESTGHIHFSMKALMKNWAGISDTMKKSYPEPAVIPSSPWLSKTLPVQPKVASFNINGDKATLILEQQEGVRWRVIQAETASGQWKNVAVMGSNSNQVSFGTTGAKRWAVRNLDSYNTASDPVELKP